jgi:hypothetical protein
MSNGMNEDLSMLAYVKAAAAALALPLDEAQAQRVAIHLARTAALARLLEQAPLTVAEEPAQVYCPAPFPSASPDAERR